MALCRSLGMRLAVPADLLVGAIILVALSVFAGLQADAQTPRRSSDHGPAVTVDLSVLDALGPARSVPRILSPRPALPARTSRTVAPPISFATPAPVAPPAAIAPPRSGVKRLTLKPPGSKRQAARRPVRRTRSQPQSIRPPRIKPPTIAKPRVNKPRVKSPTLVLPRQVKRPPKVAMTPAARPKPRPAPAIAATPSPTKPAVAPPVVITKKRARPAPTGKMATRIPVPRSKPSIRQVPPSRLVPPSAAKKSQAALGPVSRVPVSRAPVARAPVARTPVVRTPAPSVPASPAPVSRNRLTKKANPPARSTRTAAAPRDVPEVAEPIDPRIAAAQAKAAREPAPRRAKDKPTRTASLPSAARPPKVFGAGSRYRLGFASGASKLDKPAGRALDRVVDGLKSDGRLRLQLLAYAGGQANTASQSRRLSLSRALSVRSYLIDKGVRSTRIDVRALGNRYRDGPPDRVDVVVTRR